jgi:hypothetical protein
LKQFCRIAALINDAQIIEPLLDDPMPDYDCNPPLWQV